MIKYSIESCAGMMFLLHKKAGKLVLSHPFPKNSYFSMHYQSYLEENQCWKKGKDFSTVGRYAKSLI